MSVVTETHAEAGQGRALLLVVTVAYKPIGSVRISSLEKMEHIYNFQNLTIGSNISTQCTNALEQRTSLFAPETSFMEDNFSKGQGGGMASG